MGMSTLGVEKECSTFKIYRESIRVATEGCLQFTDITDRIASLIERSGVRSGFANIQSLHTTAAVMVNEHEPLLLEDMRQALERLAPRGAAYRHDDFSVRTVNLCPEEEKNGHSHCKALFLKSSETLNVVEGTLDLGRWQRVFLVELDGSRRRTVSVMVIGQNSGGLGNPSAS